MRNRIAAVVCGILLAVLGAPAVPAFAATGTTCVNFYTGSQPEPGDQYVIARSCITWDDAPAGSAWTLKEHRIWNPPGGVNYTFDALMWTNAGICCARGTLSSGQTLVKTPSTVGTFTAKFELWVHGYGGPYCIYLIPGGSNIENRRCGA